MTLHPVPNSARYTNPAAVDRVLRRISYEKALHPGERARLMRLADQWLDHRNRLTKGTNHA